MAVVVKKILCHKDLTMMSSYKIYKSTVHWG